MENGITAITLFCYGSLYIKTPLKLTLEYVDQVQLGHEKVKRLWQQGLGEEIR